MDKVINFGNRILIDECLIKKEVEDHGLILIKVKFVNLWKLWTVMYVFSDIQLK